MGKLTLNVSFCEFSLNFRMAYFPECFKLTPFSLLFNASTKVANASKRANVSRAFYANFIS